VNALTKIKICGLTRLCDIEAVNAVQPEYIGFVFTDSRRKVTPSQAAELKAKLSPDIISVGVFVNETPGNILSLVRCGIIDAVQLHGEETEGYIENIKMLTNKPVIKAVSISKVGDVQKWADTCADYLLLDNKTGGTGQAFDWNLIGEVKKQCFLAGGLNIANIETAILKINPFAVDISSGVETDGLKDSEKIISIIRKVRK
jgi:phosphoribosylanthranilate isomerase